jgi:hypothetical protein
MTTQRADLRVRQIGIAALRIAAMPQTHEFGFEINSCSGTDGSYSMAVTTLY